MRINNYIGYSKTLGICLALLLSLWIVEGQRGRSVPNRRTAIVLDNPTKEAISCNVDGIDYTVVAKGRRYLQLSNGEHYMVYDGDTTTFVKEAKDGGSILNPTGSTYVIWGYQFGGPMYVCILWELQKIEGEYYSGPYTPLTEPYIKRFNGKPEGKWYWGLDEAVPTDKSIRLPFMKGDKEYWVGKLFRYEDFRRAEQPIYSKKSKGGKQTKRKRKK